MNAAHACTPCSCFSKPPRHPHAAAIAAAGYASGRRCLPCAVPVVPAAAARRPCLCTAAIQPRKDAAVNATALALAEQPGGTHSLTGSLASTGQINAYCSASGADHGLDCMQPRCAPALRLMHEHLAMAVGSCVLGSGPLQDLCLPESSAACPCPPLDGMRRPHAYARKHMHTHTLCPSLSL